MLNRIATVLTAMFNCDKTGNTWSEKWAEELEQIQSELPSGSGFDLGTQINIDDARYQFEKYEHLKRITLETAFHHMDENGCYCGWTHHIIRVYPDLVLGFRMAITGPNENGIKEYIHEVFADFLA